MTPGKNAVKSNIQFRVSAPSGAAPCKTIAESKTPTGSPKSTKRYQWSPTRQRSKRPSRSRTPSLPPVAAVTKKAGRARPQDGGEHLDYRERQFNGQDAKPILREEYRDQADPSEPEGQHEEGHHRVVGNQTPEWGIEHGWPIRTVWYGHQGLLSISSAPSYGRHSILRSEIHRRHEADITFSA
jgi:hypothetical protein